MTKTKKIILLSVAFICLFGIMYSADFEVKSFLTNITNPFLAIADDGSEEGSEEGSDECEECVVSEECELFYIKKEKTNKCIGTLKASSVYESDPYGRKVESMIIIPGI